MTANLLGLDNSPRAICVDRLVVTAEQLRRFGDGQLALQSRLFEIFRVRLKVRFASYARRAKRSF
jgi:hypothetical protein